METFGKKVIGFAVAKRFHVAAGPPPKSERFPRRVKAPPWKRFDGDATWERLGAQRPSPPHPLAFRGATSTWKRLLNPETFPRCSFRTRRRGNSLPPAEANFAPAGFPCDVETFYRCIETFHRSVESAPVETFPQNVSTWLLSVKTFHR